MPPITDQVIAQLSVPERLELVTRIWDSIPDSVEAPPEWHLGEVERRLEQAKANPDAGMDWNEFKQVLLKRA